LKKRIEVDFKGYLDKKRKTVERSLDSLLPSVKEKPATVHRAMRYSVFAGGKRLRPILAIATFELLGKKGKKILAPACALELIHTYSLIHDDLPCMDDDDLRRGKPTCHKVFGEGIAVLAGDALHALAFELLTSTNRADVVMKVARAIGTKGMIGGQVADLEAEGKSKITLPEVRYIHNNKTGALVRASVMVGALIADASPEKLSALSEFGKNIGLAFQITDDLLDVTGEERFVGKKTHKDQLKATYPKVIGVERSKRTAKKLIQQAKGHLGIFRRDETILEKLADFVIDRSF